MSWETFNIKLNAVSKLLLTGQLKKDIDDSILEKFLSLLESSFKKTSIYGHPVDVLQNTEFMQLFGNTFNCTNTQIIMDNANISSFTIRAFGIFMSSKDAFNFVKRNSNVLVQFSSICEKDFVVYKASIHSALLITMQNMLNHPEGMSWFLNIEGITDNIFKSFSASSYYVRRNAEQFFTRLLICISSEDFKSNEKMSELFDNLVCNNIIPTLTSLSNSSTKTSCILSLRAAMNTSTNLRSLLCLKYKLLEKIVFYLKQPEGKLFMDENMILLMIDCCIYTNVKDSYTIADILNELLECQLNISLALHFMTDLFIRCKEENFHIDYTSSKDSSPEVYFILHPLLIIAQIPADIMCIEQDHNIFTLVMADSKKWMTVVNMSIICTKKIIPFLDKNDFYQVVEILCIIFSKKFSDNHIHKNKQIKRSLLDLVSSVLNHTDFSSLSHVFQLRLIAGLFHQLKIECDFDIVSSVLGNVSKCLQAIDISIPYNEDFCDTLSKKLCSFHWSVADNALEVLYNILFHFSDNNPMWLEKLCSKTIYSIVWNIAVVSQSDDYARATAVKVLALFYTKDNLWEKVSALETIDLECFMSGILSLAENEEAFVQRAALTVLTEWLNIPKFTKSRYHQLIPIILLRVIQKSSDSECKTIALSTWQNMIESCLNHISSSNKNEIAEIILRFLSDNYYVLASQLALEDFYLTVKIMATKGLLDLRKKLSALSVSKDCISFAIDDIDNSCENCEICSENDVQDQNVFSREEKNNGVDYVMNKTTLELIQSISVPRDSSAGTVKSIIKPLDKIVNICCQNRFWRKLWSPDLESKLATYSQSSDIYEQNPIALLDDILAAKTLNHDDDVLNNEYQDMDCY